MIGFIHTQEELSAMTAVQLKKLAKEQKIPKWYDLRKDKIIELMIKPNIDLDKKPVDKHEELEAQVKEWESQGNEIEVCKPEKPWKQEPPTQKSALKSTKKKRTKKASGDKPKKKSTPKRNNPDVVTLKQICEEMGIGSYKARKALRSTQNQTINKPGKQWHWNKEDTKAIEEVKSFLENL